MLSHCAPVQVWSEPSADIVTDCAGVNVSQRTDALGSPVVA